MALPKLDAPVYNLVLPSTGQEIKYRPFLVKEQKLLMMAQESEDETQISDAVTDIIDSCTNGKLKAKELPVFDVEYIFLQLRSKSVGETSTIRVLCPDDEKTYVEKVIKLDDISVHMTLEHTNIVELTDNIKIIMKYPVMNDMKGINLSIFDTNFTNSGYLPKNFSLTYAPPFALKA